MCVCSYAFISWWRHQIETFSTLLAICAGNSPVTGEFPSQRPVTWSFDVFYDLRPNKRLSKQSWGLWFKTLSCSLWRHCTDVFSSSENEVIKFRITSGYHYMAATETGSDETIHNGFRLEYSLVKLSLHVYHSFLSMDINSTLQPNRNYWTYCRFIQIKYEIIMAEYYELPKMA